MKSKAQTISTSWIMHVISILKFLIIAASGIAIGNDALLPAANKPINIQFYSDTLSVRDGNRLIVLSHKRLIGGKYQINEPKSEISSAAIIGSSKDSINLFVISASQSKESYDQFWIGRNDVEKFIEVPTSKSLIPAGNQQGIQMLKDAMIGGLVAGLVVSFVIYQLYIIPVLKP